MAKNVKDATHAILKSIQASIATLDERVSKLGEEFGQRFEHLEAELRRHRRNSAGMLVMMRATAGDFDERVREIEERVAALEARSS